MHLDKIILNLKQEYDDVFHIQIAEEDFIFRPLKKIEYDDFVINPFLYESYKAEKICEMCVLHPEEYDFFDPRYAGIPEVLMEEIIEASGFNSEDFVRELLLEYKEANEEDYHRRMENTIMAVFPHIEINELNQMNVYQIIDYYSRAEWIIQNVRGDMVHPEVVKAQREQKQAQAQKQGGSSAMQGQQQESFTFVNENSQTQEGPVIPAPEESPGMKRTPTLGNGFVDSNSKI